MAVQVFATKAATTVVTGLVGVSAYQALRKLLGSAPAHRVAVGVAEAGLRGTRGAEKVAESARLKLADVTAEARERLGEQVQPPAAAAGAHDHEH